MRSASGGRDVTYTYSYDANGNITSVSDRTYSTTYSYDSANQLVRENNQAANATWVYTYDDAGNILSKSQYAYTTGSLGSATSSAGYSYGDSAWGDLLTSRNGVSFSYDTIGNLTSDGSYTYTWEHGRELSTLAGSGSTWTFAYDANGMRTARSNGSLTYSYVYNGSSLSKLTVDGHDLHFAYDASGTPLSVTYNGINYYYTLNLQGDVTAILDLSGTAVVTYTYDAWGNILSTTGSLSGTLGFYNPLRYRGYVYDAEYGLYYLQSRYYNPALGRFINADALVSTGQGILGNNMFAYCNNNPVNMVDASGNFPKWIDDGINWFNENVIEPLTQFVEDVKEDADAFDIDNESEEKVLESNYFSSYKGVPVFRTNGNRSGSFGAIFLTRETNQRNNPEDVIRHEYGHTLQFKELGVVNYTMCIMIPSWQMWGSKEYYTKPWEITADLYGRVQSRNHAESDFMYGFAYLDASKHLGPLIWLSIE